MVDIAIGDLPPLTLAISATTKLPTRIFEMVDNNLFGDTLQAIEFTDYKAVNGLQLPTLFTNWQDKREIGQIRINRTTIDGDVGNLAAPASVARRATGGRRRGPDVAAAGRGGLTPPGNPAQELAKGLWRVTGTTHHSLIVEFNDHLMVVEANNPERVAAVWARAKELRPNKPITQLIVTHHHFDHTGGVRDAVARGVTEIIAHQHNVNFITEILKRPHTDQSGCAREDGHLQDAQDHGDRRLGRRQGQLDDGEPVSPPRQHPCRFEFTDLFPGVEDSYPGGRLHAERRAPHH